MKIKFKKNVNFKKFITDIALHLLIFFVIVTAFTLYRQPVMPDNPTWQMTNLGGQVLDIEQMSKERAVLVYFWGSWCHICKTTSPKVDELSKYSQVVTIAVSSGDDGVLGQYLKQKNYQFNTINDNDGQIFHAWQGQVTPSYVIVKDGKVVQGFVGIQPLWLLRARMAWANF